MAVWTRTRLVFLYLLCILCFERASQNLQLHNEWSPKDLHALYQSRNSIFPLASNGSNEADRRNGNRRVIECDDCGSRCVSTRIAKPMRGECVGPTSAKFYTGREVTAGSPMWRVQSLEMRSCVGNEGQANLRQQEAVGALVQIDPLLFSLTVNDVQDQCRRRWVDIRYPPKFFHTCNDPLAVEEAQIAFASTAQVFREQNLPTFRAAVALSINNLKAIGSNMTVLADDVEVTDVRDALPCNSNSTAPCDKRLTSPRDGIRVRFRVLNHEATYADLDNVLYVVELYSGELQRVLSLQLEEFVEVQMTLGRDATICESPEDQSTCLAGDVCRPVTDRAAFTDFTSPLWWSRADRQWFGGTIPNRAALREWYCDSDPRLFVGTVKIGQVGTADFYLRNSNANVKSECDAEGADRDAHCRGINLTTPVPGDCCGFCFLSNLHLMKLFSCTGMQEPLANAELVQTIADYCVRTQLCKEARPCGGEPVALGDPFEFLKASSYDIYCDPLDRGCDAAYVDGRPVQPGERVCGYKYACDFRIPAIRDRIGYYFSERLDAPELPSDSPPEAAGAGVNSAAIVVGVLSVLVVGAGCFVLLRRRQREAEATRLRKERKAFDKYAARRRNITSHPDADAADEP